MSFGLIQIQLIGDLKYIQKKITSAMRNIIIAGMTFHHIQKIQSYIQSWESYRAYTVERGEQEILELS